METQLGEKPLASITVDGAIKRVSILGREDIIVGYSLVPTLVQELPKLSKCTTLVIITDENLAKIHLNPLIDQLKSGLDARVCHYVMPCGEQSKSREMKAKIEDYLFSLGCTRDTLLIGLGGGVIGDLVGYVASTFMRGIPVIHMPTSLLAMVDSSIGGKAAIDVPAGKNLIGSFWQPLKVYVDLSYLRTLPKREFYNGMAEVIKTAAIADPVEFDRLERDADSIISMALGNTPKPDAEASLELVVLSSIRFKAYVVTKDEREQGLRGLLNFGHSVGHAIEAMLSPKLLHGECVSIGMLQEAEVSRSLGHATQPTVARLAKVLKLYSLPTSLYDSVIQAHLDPSDRHLPVDKLMSILRLDKKNIGNKKRIVLIKDIGSTTNPFPEFVEDGELIRAMSDAIKVDLTQSLPSTRTCEVWVPGSKSISNRVLLLAALGTGQCRLKGLLHSDDTKVMLDALKALGNLKYEFKDGGDTLILEGCDGLKNFKVPSKPIYLGNAGTAVRFLTSICALLRDNSTNQLVITGNDRMKQRPIGPLVDALRNNGTIIDYLEGEGCLPLSFPTNSGLKGGVIELAASVSSQYVSSILLAAPYSDEGVRLKLVGGKVISQPYIDMTLAMMEQFGVNVERVSPFEYYIPPCSYVNPLDYVVEGDASSSTYPLALAAITGTSCKVMNLGSKSLQGDSRFALDVLQPMGCEVNQTDSTTIVKGPQVGGLKALESIDMEPMTDAFLTASVLAAAVQPINGQAQPTKITGIANQRVKECNRIQAMCDELKKFNVDTQQFDDGLIIFGQSLKNLTVPEGGVHCYDDHRVAMSFSLLGSLVPGTVLLEKRCVEKTFPNWWDCLQNQLGVPLNGVDPLPHNFDLHAKSAGPDGTLVIVGMRGAGKTTYGQGIASHLGFRFIDLDASIEQDHQLEIKQLISDQGWPAFRQLESQQLVKLLSNHPTRTIISCGGGIVETPSNVQALQEFKSQGHVILHLRRDLNKIKDLLSKDPTRPDLGVGLDEVFNKREPLYQQVSGYEYVVTQSTVGEELTQLTQTIDLIIGKVPYELPKLDSKYGSSFVSLTCGDVRDIESDLSAIISGSHAVELRVDLLRDSATDSSPTLQFNSSESFQSFLSYVSYQTCYLRTKISPLPILYTVRTVKEGGQAQLTEDQLQQIYLLGLRLGTELVDVEIETSSKILDEIKGYHKVSKIIASYHDPQGQMGWGSSKCMELTNLAHSIGDVIKLISLAKSDQTNFELKQFVYKFYQTFDKPLIAINMGRLGQSSRIYNTYFTPITHPKLQTKAAPGQLTLQQINQARNLLGLTEPKKFYLFGEPIDKSPSPKMHNQIFESFGLPLTMEALSTSNPQDVAELIRSDSFGGACVTIPLKVDIIPLLDIIDPIAKQIGAVNTIHLKDNKLVGSNTDWLGIRDTLITKINPTCTGPAILLGAGGTARAALYALNSLNFDPIIVYNRSSHNLEKLKSETDIQFEGVLGTEALDQAISGLGNVNQLVVVDTLPASADLISQQWLDQSYQYAKRGVLCRLSYTNYTSLSYNDHQPIKSEIVNFIDGLDILVEQAKYQTHYWTDMKPNTQPMYQIVYEHFNRTIC